MMDAEHVAALVAERDALRAEVERLRGALQEVAESSHSDTCSMELCFAFHACDCHVSVARAALEGEG